jgi:hypothetical protein
LCGIAIIRLAIALTATFYHQPAADIETSKIAETTLFGKHSYRLAEALPSPIGEGPGVRPNPRIIQPSRNNHV